MNDDKPIGGSGFLRRTEPSRHLYQRKPGEYVPAAQTDLRKTFDAIRREQKRQHQEAA